MSDYMQNNEWKSLTPKDISVYSRKSTVFANKLLVKYTSIAAVTVAIILLLAVFKVRPVVIVSVNGESIGVVPSKKHYSEIVSAIEKNYKENFKKDIKLEDKVSLRYGVLPGKYISSPKVIAENLQCKSNIFVKATGIFVNNKLKAVVKDKDIAQKALEGIKRSYIGKDSADVNFFESVAIGDAYVLTSDIQPMDSAINSLLTKTNVLSEYIVKDGDTLWDIAEKNNISVEELYRLNPNKIDVIFPGQKIKVSIPENTLNVKTVKHSTIEENIPFDIKYKSDSELYKGERKVVSRGKSGSRTVKVEIIQKNGIEIDRKILNEKVTSQPKTEVVAIGSKAGEKNSFRIPVYGTVTSRFGYRWGRVHEGIDISGAIGTPVHAAADGVVVFSGIESGYGKLVKIRHDNGYVTYYGHNNNNCVKVGQKVFRGDKIAELGNTGRSTGPHVHFEVRKNDKPVDPLKFLN